MLRRFTAAASIVGLLSISAPLARAQALAPTTPAPTETQSPTEACEMAVIDKATIERYRRSKELQTIMTEDEALRAGVSNFRNGKDLRGAAGVAKCLLRQNNARAAVTLLEPIAEAVVETSKTVEDIFPQDKGDVWYVYALALEKTENRSAAQHAMVVARNYYGIASTVPLPAEFNRDMRRLAKPALDREAAVARAKESARIARSRRFWDSCSADERRILVERGGKGTSRDHNVGDNLGPNRIEQYDAAGYHKETWWYYGMRGEHSAEAYTFLNGKYQSYYSS